MRWRLRPAIFACALLAACGPAASDEVDAERLPSSPVEVLVDISGVPHVYAANDRDAFFGAGYMMATHRLVQADLIRRRALGRSAEVLGDAAFEDDRLARIFRWRDLGVAVSKVTEAENPEEWGLITAWVAGMNRRIEEVLSGAAPLPYGFGPGELDYRPERWADTDVLGIAKMFGFGNDLSLDREILLTIAEKLAPEATAALPLFRPAHPAFAVAPEDLPAEARGGGTQEEASSRSAPPAPKPLPPGIDPARHAPFGVPLAPPRAFAASAPPEPHAPRADSAVRTPRDVPLPPARALEALARVGRLRAAGSNNWAVDGRFTATGKPLLAGDPHLGFDFPGLFYVLHINSADAGGTFDVAGFSFPALPGVSIGHTRAVAWTPTTAFADVMDVWQVPAPDFETVVVGGAPTHVVTRTEIIRVRRAGRPIAEADDVEIEVRDVPGLGVVLPDDIAPLPVADPGHAIVLAWTGFDVSTPSRLVGLNRATTLDELEAAVDLQKGLGFNLLVADATGIALRLGVDVPVRDVAAGSTPWRVMDGSNPAWLWTGAMLPRHLLPRGRAKERGWLATANNDPFGFTKNGRLDDDPFYFGAFFAPGFRAQRIHERLSELTAEGGLTVEHMQALQLDTRSRLADDLLPLLDEALAQIGEDPALAEFEGRADLDALADVLFAWDRRMDRASAGAVAFFAFQHFTAREALADDVGPLYPAVEEQAAIFALKLALLVLRGDDPASAPLLSAGRHHVLLTALSRTAEYLTKRFGGLDPSRYRWGDVHFTRFDGALGAGLSFGEVASDGGETTINVSPTRFADTGDPAERWVSSYGPIERMVVAFADDGTPEARFTMPLGNVAGPPGGDASGDFLTGWTDGTYVPLLFRRADVEAAATERIELR